jgi:hypothetical protein
MIVRKSVQIGYSLLRPLFLTPTQVCRDFRHKTQHLLMVIIEYRHTDAHTI